MSIRYRLEQSSYRSNAIRLPVKGVETWASGGTIHEERHVEGLPGKDCGGAGTIFSGTVDGLTGVTHHVTLRM
jgi:hypothetical protein